MLLIPFAVGLSEAAAACAARPGVADISNRCSQRLHAARRDDGDEYTLSPPHERALAQRLGLAAASTAACRSPPARRRADGIAVGRTPPGPADAGALARRAATT